MRRIMILAPTVREGEAYAQEHGLDRRGVITPRSTDRGRGRAYDDSLIVNGVRLDEAEWAALTPCFLHAGEDVLDRFYYEAQGKLPPAIDLPRKTVLKF